MVATMTESLGPHKATIHRDSDGWSVAYRGVIYLRGESYVVASNVADYLSHPEWLDESECCEVACAIRGASAIVAS